MSNDTCEICCQVKAGRLTACLIHDFDDENNNTNRCEHEWQHRCGKCGEPSEMDGCTETERSSVLAALRKICSLEKHDSPIYCIASEQISMLLSFTPNKEVPLERPKDAASCSKCEGLGWVRCSYVDTETQKRCVLHADHARTVPKTGQTLPNNGHVLKTFSVGNDTGTIIDAAQQISVADHASIGAGGGDEEGYIHPDVLASQSPDFQEEYKKAQSCSECGGKGKVLNDAPRKWNEIPCTRCRGTGKAIPLSETRQERTARRLSEGDLGEQYDLDASCPSDGMVCSECGVEERESIAMVWSLDNTSTPRCFDVYACARRKQERQQMNEEPNLMDRLFAGADVAQSTEEVVMSDPARCECGKLATECGLCTENVQHPNASLKPTREEALVWFAAGPSAPDVLAWDDSMHPEDEDQQSLIDGRKEAQCTSEARPACKVCGTTEKVVVCGAGPFCQPCASRTKNPWMNEAQIPRMLPYDPNDLGEPMYENGHGPSVEAMQAEMDRRLPRPTEALTDEALDRKILEAEAAVGRKAIKDLLEGTTEPSLERRALEALTKALDFAHDELERKRKEIEMLRSTIRAIQGPDGEKK